MERKERRFAGEFSRADHFLKNRMLKQIEQRYFPALKVFLLKGGGLSEEDAEDILQETMILIDRNSQSYDCSYALSTWIYRIARNQALNFKRKVREISLPDQYEEISVSCESLPEPEYLQKETSLFIRDFLLQCSPREREAAFLFYYEAMKQREIALVLDIAEGTVKALLNRVRRKLKEAWNEKME